MFDYKECAGVVEKEMECGLRNSRSTFEWTRYCSINTKFLAKFSHNLRRASARIKPTNVIGTTSSFEAYTTGHPRSYLHKKKNIQNVSIRKFLINWILPGNITLEPTNHLSIHSTKQRMLSPSSTRQAHRLP